MLSGKYRNACRSGPVEGGLYNRSCHALSDNKASTVQAASALGSRICDTVAWSRAATERGALERAVADAVTMALRDGGAAESGDDGVGGDVLVFVPGVGEIRNVERLLMVRRCRPCGGVAAGVLLAV